MALGEERGDVIRLTPNDRPGSLTPRRQAALLAYCKLNELVDDPEVAALIPVLYEAVVGYMTNAGINVPESGTTRAASIYQTKVTLSLEGLMDKQTAGSLPTK